MGQQTSRTESRCSLICLRTKRHARCVDSDNDSTLCGCGFAGVRNGIAGTSSAHQARDAHCIVTLLERSVALAIAELSGNIIPSHS
jgi:hypothetical protein